MDTERFIIRKVQEELYAKEIDSLNDNKSIPKESKIIRLDPKLDDNGILRVGGRMKNTDISLNEKHPILIPGNHHVAKLLVIHFHEQVRHQGRHITEGAVQQAGFWITGLKRLVYQVISKCVNCRRFRGHLTSQKMGDLPVERLTSCPPFTFVGVDCFGPWDVVTRRTRGGSATSKRCAVIFACLSCRGVHIEVIEEMSTSSFINALRRFVSIRGKVKQFYSDRGTNFIGAATQLEIESIFTENSTIKTFLNEQGTVWKFNTPYSSHHGGVYERLIGVARRILDSILFDTRHKTLTHEVLCTFFAEVTAIMNSRPLVPISTDSDSPCVLSPNALLTQKTNDCVEDFSNLTTSDIYKSQWKMVQVLAENFWKHWRQEYLQSLQTRRKWQTEQENVQVGDVVIMKDNNLHRNEWPLGIVEQVFPGEDGLVRKVQLRVIVEGQPRSYARPITQIVVLCRND